MISTLLDRLFPKSNAPSGVKVKQRLKFILAHDRAAIEPQVFENMRHEIMRVVSKYVELDEGTLDIRLESDKRMTALIANLPIRMVREEMPDLDALFGESVDEASSDNNANQSNLGLEMDRSAEEALDAIAAKEKIKSIPESIDPESIAIIAERTIEVTTKIRTAANKSQTPEVANLAVPIPVDSIPSIDALLVENTVENVPNPIVEENRQLEDQSSDQLELLIELPHLSESQEVMIDESPELYKKNSHENPT
jgi:cell division topological specificity factor